MNNLQQRNLLEQALKNAEQEMALAKIQIAARRLDLMKAEDKLVNAKEDGVKAKEALRVFDAANDLISTRDDLKDLEVERFREKLPEAMKKVAHEPRLEYIRVGDLNTV